jgi:predicted nucleic acid-binding protein
LRVIDSYGWIEYFTDGGLAKKYATYIEDADESNTITPAIVIYEVYKRLKRERGEQLALEAYAQLTRTKIIPLDEDTALNAADISLAMGLAMGDAIVYSTARRHSAELITSDSDLKDLEWVRFIQ